MNRFTLSAALAAAVTAGACRENAMQPDLLASAADVSAAVASSASIFTQEFDTPISAFTRVTFASCRAPSGPGITLNTRLDLGGLRTQVAVEGETGTPDEAVATFEVVSTGADVNLPRQSDRAGVGDDPFIWVQFETNAGATLSPEIPLGRCSQLTTARDLAIDYEELGQAVAEISVHQCGSALGPMVAVAGHLALENGLLAQVIVRDDQPSSGSAEVGADAVLRIQLYQPGYDIDFRKQQLRADVDGDPQISAAFLSPEGVILGEQLVLGTCNDLTPAVGG